MKNNTKLSVCGAVIAVSAVIISLYYLLYAIFCITGFDSPLMVIFALFVIGCVTLPIVFRDRLQKLLGKAFPTLKIVFAVLLAAYIISVIGFWCYISFNSAETPEAYLGELDEAYAGENTVVMVFGCRTYGMRPSATLSLRLESAYTLLARLPDAVCIVSGGQGANETVPEALSMKEYLVSKGIDSERIIMESDSHSTSENVRFTKALLAELELEDKHIVGVSTAFHLPRISMLASRYGLPMELCSAPHASFPHHYVSMIREYLSYIKMAIFG